MSFTGFQGLSYLHEFSFILFIHHNIHIYFELCTYCKIWDIYVLHRTVIADRSLGSRNGNSVGGRRLLSGRWLLRFSKDTNGSITLRSISTSE